ncbi:MAG: hypothetical protein K1X28_07455 [Parachlamydiales bacterium]|nr:hypothetical protein [Parachlamydiales bacterium]
MASTLRAIGSGIQNAVDAVAEKVKGPKTVTFYFDTKEKTAAVAADRFSTPVYEGEYTWDETPFKGLKYTSIPSK